MLASDDPVMVDAVRYVGALVRRSALLPLLWLGLDGRALAQEHAVRPVSEALEVHTEDPCLTADLAPEVARWLPREVDASLSAVVRTPPEGGGTLLEILHDGVVVAERAFDDDDASCPERRAALALMVALALETAELEVQGAPPAELVPVESPPAPPAPEWEGGLVLGGAASLEVLPSLAGAVSVTGELHHRLLTIRLGGFGAFTADVPLERGSVSTLLVAGELTACLGERWGLFGLEGCVGAAAGALDARGHGYPIDEETWVPWVSALGEVAARFHVDETSALRVGIEVVVPVVRPEIVIAGPSDTTVAELASPVVGGAISLGWCFSFR